MLRTTRFCTIWTLGRQAGIKKRQRQVQNKQQVSPTAPHLRHAVLIALQECRQRMVVLSFERDARAALRRHCGTAQAARLQHVCHDARRAKDTQLRRQQARLHLRRRQNIPCGR